MPEDEIVLSIPEYNFMSEIIDLSGETVNLYELIRDEPLPYINSLRLEIQDIMGGQLSSVVFVHDDLWQEFSRETGFSNVAETTFTYTNADDEVITYRIQYELILGKSRFSR